MTKNDADRRRFARLDLALVISYTIVGQASGDPLDPAEGVSSDVSIGGVRLMTPTPLENGTRLALEIFLGNDQENPLHADGEVVWQNKISSTSFETGVMLKGMENADKSRFMSFVFDQMAKVVA